MDVNRDGCILCIVQIKLGKRSGKSSVVSNNLNPYWREDKGGEDIQLGLHR